MIESIKKPATDTIFKAKSIRNELNRKLKETKDEREKQEIKDKLKELNDYIFNVSMGRERNYNKLNQYISFLNKQKKDNLKEKLEDLLKIIRSD